MLKSSLQLANIAIKNLIELNWHSQVNYVIKIIFYESGRFSAQDKSWPKTLLNSRALTGWCEMTFLSLFNPLSKHEHPLLWNLTNLFYNIICSSLITTFKCITFLSRKISWRLPSAQKFSKNSTTKVGIYLNFLIMIHSYRDDN